MKKILLLLAAVTFLAVSCDRTPKNEPILAAVTLTLDSEAYAVADLTISLRDLNGSAVYESKTDISGTAEFNVLPGFYEATASFKVADNGTVYIYNGVNSNVTVVKDQSNTFFLDLTQSESNQVVIKEFYIGGCTYSITNEDGSTGTKTFQNDAYVILYNNSDQPADASSICFAGINPGNSYATNKYLEGGKLVYEAEGWLPAGQAIWWFDTNVTIAPWSQIVVAIKGAVDHTATYPESVDLSKADYVMYDPESGFNSANVYPAPSSSIPQSNYLQTSPYSAGNAWTISVIAPAFVIFRNDNPQALSQDTANYDYISGAKFPCVKVGVDSVVDGLEVFAIGKGDKNNKRLTSGIDAGYVNFSNKLGYTLYRNVDKDATEAIEGNKEKLVYSYTGGTETLEDGSTDPSGIDAEASIKKGAIIVYQDTNNSSKDFHQRKVASLK